MLNDKYFLLKNYFIIHFIITKFCYGLNLKMYGNILKLTNNEIISKIINYYCIDGILKIF